MARNNGGGRPGLRGRRERALARWESYVADFKAIPAAERDDYRYGKKNRTYAQQLAVYEREIANLKAKLKVVV